MNGLFTDNPYFNEYEARLRQLHGLIAEGEGKTEEADEVRDAMDTPWLHLTDAEVARLDGLSADLYMLQGREVFEPSDGRTKIQIGQAIFAAVKQEKWEEALVLMRKPNLIPRHRIAAIRAAAYETLGQIETSILFYRYANIIEPNYPFYAAMLMSKLAESGRFGEATVLAERYIDNNLQPLSIRVVAADVLLQGIKQQPIGGNTSLYQHIVAGLLPALADEQGISSQTNYFGIGYWFVGHCYYMLGQFTESLQAYSKAYQLEPRPTLQLVIEYLTRQQSGSNLKDIDIVQLSLTDADAMRSKNMGDLRSQGISNLANVAA